MTNISVNLLAVLVAGVAGMAIGALWYSPILFGKMWMRLSGMDMAKMGEYKKKGMGKSYFMAFIGILVMAYVLAHFLIIGEAITISDALQIAFGLWLGFIVTTKLGDVLWGDDPVALYILNIAQYLVAISVMSIILTFWQ